MNVSSQDGPLARATAVQYATWFKALADATRIQIVSLLARRGEPMTVGQITAAVDVGQSTVSAHLKVLADVRFVLADRVGTTAWYRINDACVACFPTAADVTMGRPVPVTPAATAVRRPDAATTHAAQPAAPPGVSIRPMRDSDAGQVLAIYQAGLDTGHASFETAVPDWDTFTTTHLLPHCHVAADSATGDVLGWIAASPVSGRCVYSGVVEHSLYIHPRHHRRGIGAALLQALIGSTEAAGIWTIQSGIFPVNTASLALHRKAGFRTVGTRQHIGRHHGHWRDVTLIERRSTVTGT